MNRAGATGLPWPQDASERRTLVKDVALDLASRAGLVLGVAGCVGVGVLPDPTRPVLTVAGAAVAFAVGAAATRSRLLGSITVLMTTVTVLLAAALDVSAVRPVAVLVAGALLLAVLALLERCEDAAGRPLGAAARRVVVLRARFAARAGPTVAALGASALVAATAAQDVVPSVALVLGGLAAAVAALVVTTRAHRDDQQEDVHESLSGRVPPGPSR